MAPELAFLEYLKKHNGIIPVPTEENPLRTKQENAQMNCREK